MKTHLLAGTLVAALLAGINVADAGEAPGSRSGAAPKREILGLQTKPDVEKRLPFYTGVDIGTLTLDTLGDTLEVQKKLLFLPNRLIDGIELSDDRLPVVRSEVYVLAFARRSI